MTKTHKISVVLLSAFAAFCLLIVLAILKVDMAPLEVGESEEEKEQEAGFDKPEGFGDFYRLISTPIGVQSSGYPMNNGYTELQKSLASNSVQKSAKATFGWTSRGPGNVGGRTRAVIIDPDDPTHNTWFSAAVSGGIWKTTDAGKNWQNLTNTDIRNLATTALVMAPSNHSVMYAGTGEGFGGVGMVAGNGLYVSKDKGITWDTIGSTFDNENFRYINKIIVDAEDANVLIVATNEGIFKTTNGGAGWNVVYYKGYAVQDLIANPKNPKTIYAGVNSLGIIKSYDNGNTWSNAYNGLGIGSRFSLAVSLIDSNYIFTSVEAPQLQTHVYISSDGAANWRRLTDIDGSFYNFLGVQGWFNNVIEAHPFSKKTIFIGGVYLGKIEFKSTITLSSPEVKRTDTIGTAPFMGFINFGADYLGGGMTTGLAENADVTEEDFVSVEIRFGQGSQKAHRFTVPNGEGPGVPIEDYTYRDYVTVPFQVWDTENNRQLMVSFRDQENDGKFNLIERDVDNDINGREYIYVQNVDYSNSPDLNIAKNGGHYYKMIYFLWPTLPEDALAWNPNTLPVSSISIVWGTVNLQDATSTILADNTRNKDLHVDHHDMAVQITDSINKKFNIVESNDGGLGLSTDEGNTWQQIRNNYPTTQFYGIAKKFGAEEYIGGMQDNGTWQSPEGSTASSGSEYKFQIAGDGFEALWHPNYPGRMIGSSYENIIKVTIDGGETWQDATEGIAGDGPFITRLSNSPANPNLVFAVGNKGVYRHNNFCIGRFGWQMITLGNGWAINNEVTSAHNVKVSLADSSIVWTGAGMFDKPDMHIFLSKDFGTTFDTVKNFRGWEEMGYITSIATHPTDRATAYVLFSMRHKPKIIRTTDFGESWEDITQFQPSDSMSANGFPDVMVFSLLVMPSNPDVLWAGTEIGIYESLDAGSTWHYADNGLPAVSVWQLFAQDNEIIAATHGRGIWSTPLSPVALRDTKANKNLLLEVFPNPATEWLNVGFTSNIMGEVVIQIFDASGKKLLEKKDEKISKTFENKIDLQTLNSGMYIVNLTLKGQRYLSKFVVR